jgi:hypothetical protein
LRAQLGDSDPALARAAGWTRLPLLGTEHELLFHKRRRRRLSKLRCVRTGHAYRGSGALQLDALGLRILERING